MLTSEAGEEDATAKQIELNKIQHQAGKVDPSLSARPLTIIGRLLSGISETKRWTPYHLEPLDFWQSMEWEVLYFRQNGN